jgi:hypothetical protein
MNKMKLVLTKIGIAISALAMIVAFNGASSGFAAGLDMPQDEITQAGTAETTADVVVPPWCGWNINPVTSNITLFPAGNASYVGEDLVLSGSTSAVNAYVGGVDSEEEALSSDNCSWFGLAPQSASFDVEIAENNARFTAVSGGFSDSAMGWELSEKPLVIENDFSEGCVTNGFTPNTSPVAISTAGITNAWTITNLAVITNNFCNYSVDYTATIPAGMMPTYGDSTYTFTGPSLIHTLTTG